LGKHQLFSAPLRGEELLDLVDKIVTAVCALASQKIGGLIAIERQDRLKTYVSTGVAMDSFVTSELIQSIFTPGNLLHDGGVVVQGSRIAAAACIFPITENPQFSRSFGMRHRSAIGLSEETDALVIVVSEETGKISLVKEGRVFPSLSKDELFQELKRALEPSKHKLWRR
jgi:diadenylate cyclase